LFLPHLLIRKTSRKEPLVDYNQSHIVTFYEYLQILHKKVMDKKSIEIIKEQRKKEREKTKQRCEIDSHTATNIIVERLVEK